MADAGADMDPEVARRLLEEGATLLLLGVPPGTELGVDCQSWRVGPRFKGVKMIPPGLHFLHFSPVRGGEAGPKTGLFLSLRPRDLLLATWDPEEEDLDFSASEEEVRGARAGLRGLAPFLGPYPYAALRKWVSLSDRLSAAQAERLRPLSGRVRSLGDVVPERQLASAEERAAARPENEAPCRSMREALRRLPRMKPRDGTAVRFSAVPERTFPPGAAPAEVTRCSLDRSDALEALLRAHHPRRPLRLLGELQFAFVCFRLGGAYDCFEHWKSLLALLCRSGAAVRTRPALYRGLVAVLYHQLGDVPPDFFVDIVSQSNFLTSTLQDFFQSASGPSVDAALRMRAEKFKAHLTKKFRWDFDADLDECEPVVVELPGGGATEEEELLGGGATEDEELPGGGAMEDEELPGGEATEEEELPGGGAMEA